MRDLAQVYRECLRKCDDAGVPYGKIAAVTVNTRAKSRWGQCRKNADGSFSINISDRLLSESAPLKGLEETILHEICHTVPDGLKHTGAWKKWVGVLNRRYGYAIKRLNTPQDKGIDPLAAAKESNARYVMRCKVCGHVIERQRKSSVVTQPSRYRCFCCGGALERIR